MINTDITEKDYEEYLDTIEEKLNKEQKFNKKQQYIKQYNKIVDRYLETGISKFQVHDKIQLDLANANLEDNIEGLQILQWYLDGCQENK